ncbi:MAG: tetratricopeptide repeat protein [Ignavibacteriae bacterium]|nr:tetratricopeptide repeat protein [Ignavibacteriota bacterium]
MNTMIEKGNLLLKEGRFEEARKYAEECIADFTIKPVEALMHFEMLSIYAFSFIRRSLAIDAIPIVKQMLDLCSELPEIEKMKREFRCNNILGLLHNELTKNEEGLQYLEKAYELALIIDDKYIIATITGNLGLLHSSMSNDVKALDLLRYSEDISTELGNQEHLAIVCDNIATIFNKHGDYVRALEYYSKALELHTNTQGKDGIGRALGHLGAVYFHMNEIDKAESYLFQALDIHESIDYKRGIETWHGLLGRLMLKKDDPNSAFLHYSKAIEVNRELGNKASEAMHIGSLGEVLLFKGDLEEAYKNFEIALTILQEYDRKEEFYDVQLLMARILSNPAFSKYNPVEAEQLLLQSLDNLREHSLKSIEREYLRQLSKIYKANGEWEKAYSTYEQSVSIHEELNSNDVRNTIREMEFQKEYNQLEQKRLLEVIRLQEKEQLLHEILPSHVADRIIGGEKTIAEECEDMTIMFADIVGFTTLSEHMKPSEIIELLNTVYSKLDILADTYGIEKIKTIGDAYMAISDSREDTVDHKLKMLTFAKEILSTCSDIKLKNGKILEVRIGIHSGPTVTGVIGTKKLSYDVWGDAVNTAARMESYGEPGTIQVSREFYDSIRHIDGMIETTVITEKEIAIKGKGLMNTIILQ